MNTEYGDAKQLNQTNMLDIYAVMAFLIGLLSANNILYVFVVGSTPIYTINVFCVICFVVLTIIEGGKIPVFSNIPVSLKVLLFFIVLSFLPVILFNRQYTYRWFVGIISLILSLVVIYVVMWLEDYHRYIYIGVAVGIIINAAFTLYTYILYQQGIMFTLSDYFPALNMPIQYSSNPFRAWGLFKEPGHMMRYMAIMFLPTYKCLFKKNRY